jgi:AAA+ ATPase superfamily predicted ATPase
MNLIEIWHYHRPELAKLYLSILNAGIVTSTTIFAPRRAGKTSFLIKDLSPEAKKSGYNVVYIDLWQTKFSPELAIIKALENSVAPKNSLANIAYKLKKPISKISAKANIIGTSLEGEIALENKNNHNDLLLKIDDMIGSLCEKLPLLLLIDEAQELARTKQHESLATALRTSFTKNQDKLRVVFTGSSRTKLAHVFSNSNAPLYSTGSAIIDFPKLGKDFIQYINKKFSESTGKNFCETQAWEAFLNLKQQPEPFLIGIVELILNPNRSFADAMDNVAQRLLSKENHEGVWNSLDELQKALLRMLANSPTTKPFSKSVIIKLRNIIGIESLEITHVQRAMTKLENIVFKSLRDNYEFENEAFAKWITTLAD